MYIVSSVYNELPKRQPTEPRQRYRQYYRDMHNRYKLPLDERTFMQGSQYKYHEMGYLVFDELVETGHLVNIDLAVGTYWAHEFDPDYASCGPHFAHHYGLNCSMFDVMDQGSICTLTALSLIHKYQINSNSQRTLCFAFDQTSIPRSDAFSIPIPTIDAAAAIVLSSTKPDDEVIQIIDVCLWPEQQLCEQKFDVIGLLNAALAKNNLKLEDGILCCKRNTAISRAIQLYKHQYPDFEENAEQHDLPLGEACSDVLKVMNDLHHKKWSPKRHYVYVIDEDVESLTTGLIILALPNKV